MIKKAFLGFVFFGLANSAAAQWEVTAGYSQFELGGKRLHFDLGAAVIGAGYRFPISDTFSITPIVRIGFGIKDDDFPWTIAGVENGQPMLWEPAAKIKVDKYYGLQVRGEFQVNDKAYLFVVPSYSVLDTKISVNYQSVGLDFSNYSVREEEDGFGIGAGAGWRFTDLIGAELSYETADFGPGWDLNTLSAQLRFAF